ncbi:MAG: RNA 2',3'-cyclic phosphodiesterase [Anaerolineae bacterium]|nr:RNA 2',3'-cyclic phosphodiesterase [Anaerolineae bacterium]NIN99407.1 RNA 2',3'-cyclic phosphodiesterase [Anaerolineae bacterium]NIQ82272.1 RNA 2',3'-cyclic phosphodiesterase [Anaerolineae bacterium]
MEQIRTFVAIELDDGLKKRLTEAQDLLKGRGIADLVRWVKPGGIHLTLKFLGNVPADRINEIIVAINQGSRGIRPFALSFGRLGCFPSPSRPNVIWIGVDGDTETLTRLQGGIENRLSTLGHPPEKRKYTPHLTLGRVARHVETGERRQLGRLIEKQSIDLLGEMTVLEVSLMKSELSPAGAKYSRLAAIDLER